MILEAARRRGQAADHLLFAGPPGLGKTTLAGIVAAEMGGAAPRHLRPGARAAPATSPPSSPSSTRATSCSSTRSTGSRAPSRRSSTRRWRTSSSTSWSGKGPAASSIRLDLPRFTLVGATTRTGLDHRAAARPLRPRGPARLLRRRRARGHRRHGPPASSACSIDDEGAAEIARRSRGTPRIANRLLRRVRDFAEVRGDGADRPGHRAATGWPLFGVDERGLDKVDRAILARAVPALRRRPGRACPRSPSAWASRPRRSRTSTSRSSSSRACSMRTPRGRVAPPRRPTHHLGLPATSRSGAAARFIAVAPADREVAVEEGDACSLPRGRRRPPRSRTSRASWLSKAWPAPPRRGSRRSRALDRRLDGVDLLVRDVGVVVAEVEEHRARRCRRPGRASPATPEP